MTINNAPSHWGKLLRIEDIGRAMRWIETPEPCSVILPNSDDGHDAARQILARYITGVKIVFSDYVPPSPSWIFPPKRKGRTRRGYRIAHSVWNNRRRKKSFLAFIVKDIPSRFGSVMWHF